MVDGLEGVHELAGDALVGKLDAHVELALLLKLELGGLFLDEQHAARLVLEHDRLLRKVEAALGAVAILHAILVAELEQLLIVGNI